jgi:2-polyprenyl-6-methoxyphenol hydroxylase-like FAD-dependent oxidoreductase
LARRGWSVSLLMAADPHLYGETLPPECNPLLHRLGLWEALERSAPLESPGIVSYWGRDDPFEQDFIGSPHGPGWHVDRIRFDEELRREAARAGAVVRSGPRVRVVQGQSGDWQCHEIRARLVIDATGRNGIRVGPPVERDVEDTLLVLVLRLSCSAGGMADLRTRIWAVSNGWWYLSPVPGGGAVAMFFTCREEYGNARQHAPRLGAPYRLGHVIAARWISVSSSIRKSLYGDGWIAVGDSTSSYDPLSGRGIFKALRHASSAAEAVDSCLQGRPDTCSAYASKVASEFREYTRQRKTIYNMERRWPSSPFWRRYTQDAE